MNLWLCIAILNVPIKRKQWRDIVQRVPPFDSFMTQFLAYQLIGIISSSHTYSRNAEFV